MWILGRIWKDMLVVVGWAVGIAVIALKTFYENPLAFQYYAQNPLFSGLDLINLVLIFVVSTVAGILLVKAETVLIGFVGSLALSILTLLVWFFFLTGEAHSPYVLIMELLFFRAISLVFRLIFPGIITFCFLGALVGGFIGERLRLRLASYS